MPVKPDITRITVIKKRKSIGCYIEVAIIIMFFKLQIKYMLRFFLYLLIKVNVYEKLKLF